jgi:hypothetical protein
MFLRVMYAITEYDHYFMQRPNAANKMGCSPLQKVTASLRMLAYGCAADSLDSDLRMGEATIIESLMHFVRAVLHVFGPYYLRRPNDEDIGRLLQVAKKRGFPGMLGSIDCMHWAWEKCPVQWQGYFKGHFQKPTMILEAVAGDDLWIWHAFFGLPGSLNDINVLHRSPVFDDLASGNAPNVNFNVNGHDYNMAYYLGDGIYPNWATLVKGIRHPLSRKQSLFTRKHSAYRKDVERAFRVLQAKFQICKGPTRMWKKEDIKCIMDCVVVLHNMVVEDERGLPRPRMRYYENSTPPKLGRRHKKVCSIHGLIANHKKIRSPEAHANLQADLIIHVWEYHGRHKVMLLVCPHFFVFPVLLLTWSRRHSTTATQVLFRRATCPKALGRSRPKDLGTSGSKDLGTSRPKALGTSQPKDLCRSRPKEVGRSLQGDQQQYYLVHR